MPFVVNVKKTYEYVAPGKSKEHNTWISQPGSGLDKRQCSLQVMVRGEGKQPKIAIIFRGKGNVKQHEKQAWHPDVDVYFQPNAWVDEATCMKWTEKTLKKFVEDEQLDKFLLFCDNLEAQCSDSFKETVHKMNGLVWYGLKNGTDLWQVVDAGVAQLLKNLIAIEHNEWLDIDENADPWFCHKKKFTSSERRILITHWAGKAWEKLTSPKLTSPKYASFIRKCWQKTGCLMTADDSDDKLIQPEGLLNYSVQPPSILDPAPQLSASNVPQPTIEIEDDEDETPQITTEDELVEGDEIDYDDDTPNIFDFIDRLMLD